MENKKTKRNDLFLVDPKNIIIEEGFNVRKDYGDIDGLMESIIKMGQLEPIQGTKVKGEDKYILTDGHRRMTAILKAIEKGHDIPSVKLIPSSANIEDRIFAMVITGIGKKPLSILEESEAYKRLVSYHYEVKEIAEKVGKSVPHVYNALRLADVPKQVKNAIENEEISGTTVMTLIREVKNNDELISVINEAIADAKKDGVKKKATIKNVVRMKTPMQKLTEAFAIAEEKNYSQLDLIRKLFGELFDKDSTAESIANLFK